MPGGIRLLCCVYTTVVNGAKPSVPGLSAPNQSPDRQDCPSEGQALKPAGLGFSAAVAASAAA